MRCLAVAQTWIDLGGTAILATKPGSFQIENRYHAENICVEHILSIPGSIEDANEIIKLSEKNSSKWVIIDGYHFHVKFFKSLKNAGLKTIFIDDFGQITTDCIDIIVNPNIYAKSLFSKNHMNNSALLLGPEYYPIRREFFRARNFSRDFSIRTIHILITMGGADPKNITWQIIKALDCCDLSDIEIIVLVGPQNKHYEKLKDDIKKINSSIRLIQNPRDIPELMIWADIGISSAGTTTYELAFMRLPSFIIKIAENQLFNINTYSKLGVFEIINNSDLADPSILCRKIQQWIENPGFREQTSSKLSDIIDGYGSERIFANIEDSVVLRPVHKDDCYRIWQWANDPDVRASSFNSLPISLEDHKKWFFEKIGDKNCLFFIVTLHTIPIAQLRFDLEGHSAKISFMIDKDFRGKGYGEQIIRLACRYLFRKFNIECIHAYVLQSNSISIKTFTKSGFHFLATERIHNHKAIHFVLEKDDYYV